jgi:hypothetical protein
VHFEGNCGLKRSYFEAMIDFIGKILYPRRQLWERRRKVETIFIVFLIVLLASALMGFLIYLADSGSTI